MVRKPSAHLLASLLCLSALTVCVAACSPRPSEPVGEEPAKGDPAQACAHVRELAQLETQDPAVLDQVERECLETLGALQTRYETFATCVTLASSTGALVECEKGLSKPPSLLAAAAPTSKLEALCDHVLGMLAAELGEAQAQMNPGELEELRSKCITDAGKQLEIKGVEAFNAEADCILAADKLDALQACGQ